MMPGQEKMSAYAVVRELDRMEDCGLLTADARAAAATAGYLIREMCLPLPSASDKTEMGALHRAARCRLDVVRDCVIAMNNALDFYFADVEEGTAIPPVLVGLKAAIDRGNYMLNGGEA